MTQWGCSTCVTRGSQWTCHALSIEAVRMYLNCFFFTRDVPEMLKTKKCAQKIVRTCPTIPTSRMNNILSLNQSITLTLSLSLSFFLLSFNIHHSFHSIWILERRLLRTFSNADEWWRDQLKKQSIRLRASPARLSQSHCRNWRFFILLFFWSFLLGLLNCRLYPSFSRFICYLFSKNLKIWLLTYILWVFTL